MERIGWALSLLGDLLLVLDSCEATPLAAWLTRWSSQSPRLTILATSRTPIGLRDEVVIDVPPLDPGPAAALVRDRAARRGHPVDPEDEPAIEEMVELVGRVPLFLELAGSWLGVARPGDVVRWVRGQGLDALRSFDLDSPARHASARTVLDASWAALGAESQRALAAWTVFEGPFSMEAALAVSGSTDLRLVRSLVDSSLVGRRGPLLDVPPIVRSFVGEHLDPADAHRARRAHAAMYGGPHPDDDLVRDLPQLAAAARWASAHDPELAVAVTVNLGRACAWVGSVEPFRSICAALRRADLPASSQAPLAIADVRHRRALGEHPLYALHDVETDDPELQLVLATLRVELALDRFGTGPGTVDLGPDFERLRPVDRVVYGARRLMATGSPAAALGLLRSAQPEDPRTRAYVLELQGRCHVHLGDVDLAPPLLEEALRMNRALGNRPQVRLLQVVLAEIDEAAGRLEEAAARYRELIAHPLGYELYPRVSLANLDAQLGHATRAESDARAAFQLATAVGAPRAAAFARIALAHALQRQGRATEAVAEAEAAFEFPDAWVQVHAASRRAALGAALGDVGAWVERGLAVCDQLGVLAATVLRREIEALR